MDFEALYKDTFSQVHASAAVNPEAYRRRERTIVLRRGLLLAAVVCLLAALCATAYAADWFGLRSFVANERDPEVPVWTYDPATAGPDTIPDLSTSDVLSFQGLADSPESRAALEWQSFLETYDADGTIIQSIGNAPTPFDADYGCYLVYTQEMADELDRICAKYGLKKHTSIDVFTHGELVHALGGEFLLGNHMKCGGYIYEDGYFHIDGQYLPPSGNIIDYQLIRSVKGTLTDGIAYIGDVDALEQWEYERQGQRMVLALGTYRSYILADMPDCSVSINVLCGTAGGDFSADAPILTRALLEELADSFDWARLATVNTDAL